VEFYKFSKTLGKGSFGKVILGIHILTGKKVAIKIIEKSIMKNASIRAKILQEVYILQNVKHANIIRLLEVFEENEQLFIVMEYASNGDLLKHLKNKGRMNEKNAKIIFKQIVYGLGNIHSKNILHRDIKLDNILLDSENNVKICDFGVSKILTKNTRIYEKCGTPAYIAPEVISGEGYENYYIDHWSLGIVLYAMLCITVPFKAENMNDLLQVIKITKVSFPVKLSQNCKDLILNLLKINPYERLSIPKILLHPWLSDMKNETNQQIEEDFMNYANCVNSAYNPKNPNIKISNVGNLFFDKFSENEKLSYSDYCNINEDSYTNHIDEDKLKKCETYGFPRELILNSLKENILNHGTATYNLLILP